MKIMTKVMRWILRLNKEETAIQVLEKYASNIELDMETNKHASHKDKELQVWEKKSTLGI